MSAFCALSQLGPLERDEFLSNGVFLSWSDNRNLVGFGRVTADRTDVLHQAGSEFPQVWAPNFFFEARDLKPQTFRQWCWLTNEEFRTFLAAEGAGVNRAWQEPNFEGFSQAFLQIQDAFLKGLQKAVPVVFAEASGTLTPAERAIILKNMIEHPSGTTAYGLWTEAEGVLGVTPEILFRREGTDLHTMALAGTAKPGDDLLGSPKDREEHLLVIQDLIDCLRPYGDLHLSDTYEWKLPNLKHLRTDIVLKCQACEGRDTAFWLQQLHPTPALGVAPRRWNFRWLKNFEVTERRRFGAPFAIDLPNGETLCVVAIRNVQWDAQKIYLGSGCGVVSRSQLESEWRELKLKRDSTKNLLLVPNNIALARSVAEQLVAAGVNEFVVCSGARNSPFVALLESVPGLKVWQFFDERAAAFFALGRMKQSGQAAAVVTTSGTAVAELLPATVEAFYSGFPLVLVTADRPRSYRGTGAPQAINQVGIFGEYVEKDWDLEWPQKLDLASVSWRRPLQINLCFFEPLLNGPASRVPTLQPIIPTPPLKTRELCQPLTTAELRRNVGLKPLIVVGGLPERARVLVKNFLLRAGAPIYAEAHSGLRDDGDLRPFILQSGERLLKMAGVQASFDSVIRIGGVPTLRFWRDLEEHLQHLPVLSFVDVPFSGLSRPSRMAPLAQLEQFVLPAPFAWGELRAIDDNQTHELQKLWQHLPLAEVSQVHALSKIIPPGSHVFLGNSLPIREWDLGAHLSDRHFTVHANRGVNGIDGLISTFLGASRKTSENWLVLGDLSALYDLSGFWPLTELQNHKIRIVVINNGGGMIFSRMFHDARFENRHQLHFGGAAQMFGLEYHHISDISQLPATLGGHTLIELVPDHTQSQQFWSSYEKIFGG